MEYPDLAIMARLREPVRCNRDTVPCATLGANTRGAPQTLADSWCVAEQFADRGS